ncbi:ligand-binding sensor domain-containing protein [Larkinella bovis]
MKGLLDAVASYGAVLLFAFVFSTSGYGQAGPNAPRGGPGKRPSIWEGQPKLIRTQGVESGNVGCELQDKAGNLWFSTGGQGVYRYDGKSFTNFTTRNGLSDNEVSVIIEDKAGHILFGTKSGICQYDGKTFTNYLKPGLLAKVRITCLFEDRGGNLWFGTMGTGLYRYDGRTLTNFLNNDDHPFNLGAHYQLIMDILQDRNGVLWFCSWNGGGVWQYDGKSFKNFLPAAEYYRSNEDQRSAASYVPKVTYPLSREHLTDDMIFSMAEDRAGNLWFATRRHGACCYDGKSFTSFREKEGFVSYGITAILEDKKGYLWLATDKNGVFRYDGKTFKNYTTKDGLVNNSVRSILEDKTGNLWFGTRAFGLSRYDGKTFITFSE